METARTRKREWYEAQALRNLSRCYLAKGDLKNAERTARQMDHLPISGPDGSLVRLAGLPARDRVYTHINNTNPMLIEDGPERAAVEAAGIRIGFDGMRFTL